MRFHVQSDSRPGIEHLVDLQANGMNGFCGCEDFQARRAKLLRLNGVPCQASRCHHIREVREWLLDRFLDELVKQTGQVEEPF